MTGLGTLTERQVVPRWRPWRTTALLGEAARRRRTDPEASPSAISRLLAQYQSSPSLGRAGDLLSVATVYGQRDDVLLSIANNVAKDHQGTLLADLAQSFLDTDLERYSRAFQVETIDSAKRISRLRQVLVREPRNSLRWADLAREYVALGQHRQAERSMRTALGLAVDDRFILRSAAAMYVQLGDLDHALGVLTRSPRLNLDPWLLAPAVAIADLSRRKVKLHRRAYELLEHDFAAVELAELSAALGTVELDAGSSRRARQLLRRSALDPTENALAQVEWISTKQETALLTEAPVDVPRAFEAVAHRADHEGRWTEALTSATCWLVDQPFSANAAMVASFSACEAEDWTAAIRLAEDGLRANPSHITLLNNLSFAQIEVGEIRTAAEHLKRARSMNGSREDKVVLAATEALFCYRAGLTELGRHRYQAVVEAFLRAQERDYAAKAALMLAREESLLASSELPDAWKRADELAAKSKRADVVALHQRVKRIVEMGNVSPGDARSLELGPIVEPLLDTPPELDGIELNSHPDLHS